MNLPPVCKTKNYTLTHHNHSRQDPFFWLNERENPEVLSYIEAENQYCDQVLAHTAELQKSLFEEMKARIKQQDESLPYKRDNYYYYLRYQTDQDYPIQCRKFGSLQAEEEVLLDYNSLAQNHSFFAIGGLSVSADHNFLAFSFDTIGRNFFQIGIKNLKTQELQIKVLENTTGDMTWLEDGSRLLYVVQDKETLRACKVFAHGFDKPQSQDELIYFEQDETFSVSLEKSKSRKYIFINCHSTLTSEVLFSDSNLISPFVPFCARERGIEYGIEHKGEDFFILTNYQAQNFRLMKSPIGQTDRQSWQEVVEHRQEVMLEAMELFNDFLVLQEREQGLLRLRVIAQDSSHIIEMSDPAYSLYIGYNPEFDSNLLRFHYQSLTTPSSVYDYNMSNRERVLVKQHEVVGGYEPADYVSERHLVQAQDGEWIPLSLVYKKTTPLSQPNPVYLAGYGAYGISYDPYFSTSRLSLLNRGVIFAIAHVRGGEDKGRQWYEAGKLLQKKNTFSDFADCAAYLIEKKITQPNLLVGVGGSAGGLLIGVMANQYSHYFGALLAQVPFVDVLTTMLDESIPLTTGEYDEWGNPNQEEFYHYMLSYSPYDNVKPQNYPAMLITTGLHDSQVQYWEPLKWTAKLRLNQTGDAPILLKTNTEAGHSGAQGRFKHLQETALEYAFLLWIWKLND
jgi:oligopeptidase B